LKGSYTALKIKFCLPKEILYPPFPVTLDESITIYPSSGESLVTGLEFLTGLNILNSAIDRFKLDPKVYFIEVLYGAIIPFKKEITEVNGNKVEALAYKPFFSILNELQASRRE
jgi:hypothetical protein